MPPPHRPVPPVEEPDPDRLPDEVPDPNPDETDVPPRQAPGDHPIQRPPRGDFPDTGR